MAHRALTQELSEVEYQLHRHRIVTQQLADVEYQLHRHRALTQQLAEIEYQLHRHRVITQQLVELEYSYVVPEPPDDCSARGDYDNLFIGLEWIDTNGGVFFYQIWRSDDGGPFNFIAVTPLGAESYDDVDPTIAPDHTYMYRICGVNGPVIGPCCYISIDLQWRTFCVPQIWASHCGGDYVGRYDYLISGWSTIQEELR